MNGALWLLLAGSAAAGPANESVMSLLDAFEAPIDAASVAALGPGASSELVAVSRDASVPPTRRARAITALRHVPTSDEVLAALRSHLGSDELLLRRHAALSLAVVSGDRAVDDLVPLLADPDTQLRLAVAQALGGLDTPRARAALQARLAEEPAAVVVQALTEALEPGEPR